jgi:L-seryl-tRNA(Ser) seleniumtransferase
MSTMPNRDKQDLLRRLPRTDGVVADPALAPARARLGERALTALARAAIAEARHQALATGAAADHAAVVALVRARAEALLGRRAQRVINATGVVLHTNLGRAPLSEAAAAAVAESARGYTSIELDLASGKRGARGAFLDSALAQLAGAEAAVCVNNNAAAVLLALAAFARGRGVIVSRGEQIEIGGGFRVPEVLAQSGARMIEVGTTNKTRLSDYARALDESPEAAAILRVHQTNFRQIGFVERPELRALCELARARGVMVIKDLGGGALSDLADYGLRGEPLVQDCVAAGVDLLCFSCDKILGGPQGGAIVGAAPLVARLRKEPLLRALRLGRLPMVALEATLSAYLTGDLDAVPVLAAIRRPVAAVRERVERWCRALAAEGIRAEPRDFDGAVGAGALAEEPIRSVAAAILVDDADGLAARLRAGHPPVLGRILDGALCLDGRTVLPHEDAALLAAVTVAAR